jgi:hypothetical protein
LDLAFASRIKPGHVVGFFVGLIVAVGLVPKTDRAVTRGGQDTLANP